MDSDIDADPPVRIKPTRRLFDLDHKSPTLPTYQGNNSQSNKPVSPISTYSSKSSKDQLDVSEIRRILGKLKLELDTERKKNQDLEHSNKQLEDHGLKTERKYKEAVAKLIASSKKKLEDGVRNAEKVKNDEISQLQQKIEDLSGKLVIKENGIDVGNILDIISTIDHLCNHGSGSSSDWGDMKKDISNLKQSLNGHKTKETSDSKLQRLKEHNHELTKVVKMLDIKLTGAKLEIENLTKKLEVKSQLPPICDNIDNEENTQGIKFEDTLQRANVEIIQLQKQITWLKNSDNGDPATKERVQLLSNLIHSFKDNQHNLEKELSNLREKCKTVEFLTVELSRVKNENQKLVSKCSQFSSSQKNIDIPEQLVSSAQISESENFIKIEKLENLNKHYFNQIKSMERLLKQKDQIQSGNEENSEDSTENLKVKLREMEKRRTQQALNYEEALLELEALKKNSQRQNIDFYRRNGAKDDANNSSASSVMEGLLSNMEIGKVDIRESSIFGRGDGSSVVCEDEMKSLIDLKNNVGTHFGLNKEDNNTILSLDNKNEKQRKHVAAPIQIRIDNQSNSRIVRWKSPDVKIHMEDCQITSYHIYMDGDFFRAVGANESLSATLPNLDSKTHRVSIRSVCPHGQSKDSQCTIEINSNTPAPSVLKANKITGTSAHVSWMPSNSTYRHTVWVNGVKFCDCLPGIYKILLQGLTADSLQKVRVHPVLDQYPDSTTISAYLDFQTLPVSGETKIIVLKKQIESVIEEIEPPRDVKLKLGNRLGKFLVRWSCSPDPTSPSIKLVGYQILINNQCIALVNGAKNDRFSLNLVDLREISLPTNQKLLNSSEQSFLPLTVRTLGTIAEIDATDCTVLSKDSQPPLKFSGHIAARIAGTAGDAAMMLGDPLALFLNLIESNRDASFDCRGFGKITQSCRGDMTNAKSCWHSCYCLNNTDCYDDDSSFLPRSKFDWIENKSTPYRSISNNFLDQPLIGVSCRSLSDDSALDRLSGTHDNRDQFSNDCLENDSGSTGSSTNSRRYSQNNVSKTYNLRRRSMTDQSSRDPDMSTKYLAVRRTPKNSRSPKTSPKDHSQAKISVPKIQITKDSSFSEDDENLQLTQYKNKPRSISDPNKEKFPQRNNANQYSDYSARSGQIIVDDQMTMKQQSRMFPSNASDRVPTITQRPVNNYNNGITSNGSAVADRYYYGNQQSSDPIRYFVALYDYDPGTMSPNPDAINEELPFKTGQTVKIFGQVDEDGFYTGETNGRRGLVPSNMVKEIDNTTFKSKFKPVDDNNVDQKRKQESTMPKNPQVRTNQGQYNLDGHHDYMGGNQSQYDQYQVPHRKSTDSGVSYAASDPNSYQKPPPPDNLPRQSQNHSVAQGSLNGKRMVALYDYDPQVLSPNVDSDAELAFKANDIITILSDIDEDGFYLGERNGQRGLVPSNFLTEAISQQTGRLRNQQSFDGPQNQNAYKERNFSASSNFSDPPPVRENRFRGKVPDNDRDNARNHIANNDEYLVDRNLEVEHPKIINNTSFEESFDSGPSIGRSYVPKPEPKRVPYQSNIERRSSINNEPHSNANEPHYPRSAPISNQIPPRTSKPLDDRRIIHDKPIHPTQSSIKLPPRRQSPPPPLEQDDMPIVMDLAPSKENQKKKKLSSVPDNYRTNLSDTHDNYGNSDNLYANSNSSMSDNLERKRSVFKNPFKKKKS